MRRQINLRRLVHVAFHKQINHIVLENRIREPELLSTFDVGWLENRVTGEALPVNAVGAGGKPKFHVRAAVIAGSTIDHRPAIRGLKDAGLMNPGSIPGALSIGLKYRVTFGVRFIGRGWIVVLPPMGSIARGRHADLLRARCSHTTIVHDIATIRFQDMRRQDLLFIPLTRYTRVEDRLWIRSPFCDGRTYDALSRPPDHAGGGEGNCIPCVKI